jgi:hypothetical protein
VYSIRVPVERLEQVRRLASERNIAPTTMLRQWVLTQLDAELGIQASGSPPHRADNAPGKRDPRGTARQRQDSGAERLEAATTALVEVAANLTKTLTIFADVLAQGNPAFAQPIAITARPQPFIWGTPTAVAAPTEAIAVSAALRPTINYLGAGLAALRSTIDRASAMPGIPGNDLYSLYEAADEELSTS